MGLLYGIAPRAVSPPWIAVVHATLRTFFGPLLNPPPWLHNVSPVDHIARLPHESLSLLPVLAVTAVAAVAAAGGLLGFRSRDVG